MFTQDEPSMFAGLRSALWVLTMPLGYAAACATMAAGASLSLLLEPTGSGFEAIPRWRSEPGAAVIWLAGATVQLTLVGMVLAAPVAVPVMMIFRHRHVTSAWVYALAGALVVAGAALFLHLVLGLAFRPLDLAILIAVGPLAGLVYWLIASRRPVGRGSSDAPPGSG